MGGCPSCSRLSFVVGSTKLMDWRQDSLAFFAACQRAKSAPSIKNFRPIWTIRICSSSMILRKWRTENPASSAAFGISRNVFFTTIPSVDFIGSSFVLEEYARRMPDFWCADRDFVLRNYLFFAHERISIVGGWNKVFLDRS